MSDFCLPSLGADMDEGRLVEWLVEPGDRVKKGDLIVVVETTKASVEVEVWEDGVVEELLVEPGTTIPVGTVLARIRSEADASASTPTPAPPPTAAPAPPPVQVAPTATAPRAERRASPRARKRAAELGVDLAAVTGTGAGGAVTGEDVERAAAGDAPSPPPTAPPSPPQTAQASDAMRRTIAAAMTRAKQTIPHYYLAHRVPLAKALSWLETTNAERPIAERLLPAALLIKAIAAAVAKVPEVNGHYRDGAFQVDEAVHLGVAVALRQGGLVAPALRDVASKPLDQVMAELRDLVARTRQGSLRASELGTATLTLSNVGDRKVDAVYGVIHPPQVALVGAGQIREVPWVVDGQVVPQPAVDLTLSADHRVSDGARGARFLAQVDRLLQRPEAL